MLIALMLLQAVSSPSTKPVPLEPTTWVSPDDYPADAQKTGAGGTVRYSVSVDAKGRAGDCRITQSSGSSSLDSTTCTIVTSKGRFQPAAGADGKPIAGTYDGSFTWKANAPSAPAWRATTIEFATDSQQPKCTEEAHGGMGTDPTRSCSKFLEQTQVVQQLARRFSKVVYLVSTADGDDALYRGDPTWGLQLSLLASEQYYLRGSYPVSCKTVAAQGMAAGRDACAGMPNNRPLTADEAKSARKTRLEVSTFGVPLSKTR